MQAVIYTKDDAEYRRMEEILLEENPGIGVRRDPLDGHGHYGVTYDIVVAALDGAKGMEIVLEWSKRYRHSQIIWITSDPDFAGMAIRRHIYDFIVRPCCDERFRESVRGAIARLS